MSVEYRIVGTDKHGRRIAEAKLNPGEAFLSASQANRRAAKHGELQDWVAQVGEWRRLDLNEAEP